MIAVIIQARMGSSRLPGKVLEDLGGAPLLQYVIERASMARRPDVVVVATTQNQTDDRIGAFCLELGTIVFRGSEHDVLDRYYRAAEAIDANVIVRVTADCPFIDPDVLDRVVDAYLEGAYDYSSNAIQRTYPDGLDVEVLSFEALDHAWREAKLTSEREHVTPFIWKNPDLFRICHVTLDRDLSSLRWTVDEPLDLEFVRQVYDRLGNLAGTFRMKDVLELLNEEPELQHINAGIELNEGYRRSVENDRKIVG